MQVPFKVPALAQTIAFVVAMAVAGTDLQAQSRNLRGIVTDTSGRPIQNAEVRIMELGRVARTDSTGAFAIPRLTARVVDLTIRRLGYEMRFMRVSMISGEGDSVVIALASEPVVLAGVEIEAPEAVHPNFAEFERRRSRGIGMFLTQADMEKNNSSYTSDAFRTLPGVRLVRVNGGMGVRFGSTQGMRSARGSECQPMIWVDGQRAPGMEVDDIRANDVYGVEVYRGASTTPVQFATGGATQCGVIAVWTRRRGR